MLESKTENISQRIHRQATAASISDIARFLQEVLSRRLTAYAAGVQEGKTVTRWASGEVTEIRDFEVEQRLRTTYEIVLLLLVHESPNTVKAWFIGMNPELDDVAPVEAIRNGQLKDAMIAANVFFVYG
jgi:hypothetical protein